MKPICVPCQRFYRMTRSGYYFIEGMPRHNGAQAGTVEPEAWQPYKIWSGDLWTCEGCGAQVISGTGRSPIAEHYQSDFSDRVSRLQADQFQVNDC